MKQLFFLFCLLSIVTVGKAQKIINDPNAEARNVGSFTGLDVSGGIDVYLSSGNEAVAVSASETDYRDRIKTEVENGILKIWHDSKWGISINGNKNLKAYVSYKTLKSLKASGGSDIQVDHTIKGPEFLLQVSGGSDFRGAVDITKLVVKQSGGSDINISGRASHLSVDASGGSDFNGYDLSADVCDLEASGGCDIEITAKSEISARASGASDISYKGKPGVKEVKASGASSVKAKS